MDYFWLKKRTFLGSNVSHYIFMAGLLVVYSSKYSLNCSHVDYDDIITFSLNETVADKIEANVDEGTLLYISFFEPENIELTNNYTFDVSFSFGSFDDAHFEPVTYFSYIFNFGASIEEKNTLNLSFSDIKAKDDFKIIVNADLDERQTMNLSLSPITFIYPKTEEIYEIDTASISALSFSELTERHDVITNCYLNLITRFYFDLNDVDYRIEVSARIGELSHFDLMSIVPGYLVLEKTHDVFVGTPSIIFANQNMSFESLEIKDGYNLITNAELEHSSTIYLDGINITYNYPNYDEISSLETPSAINTVFSDCVFNNKLILSGQCGLSLRVFMDSGEIIYNQGAELGIEHFHLGSLVNLSFDNLEIKENYDLSAEAELQLNNFSYLDGLLILYSYPKEIGISTLNVNETEEFELDDIYSKKDLEFYVGMRYLDSLNFSSWLAFKNYVMLEPVSMLCCEVSPIDLGALEVKDKKELSVSIELNGSRIPLNNLQVSYSSSIMNYVNIILYGQSELSLSLMEIKDKIALTQNLTNLEVKNISFSDLEYSSKYSTEVGTVELEKVRQFYDLLGLKFNDLDGLEFIDLMFVD